MISVERENKIHGRYELFPGIIMEYKDACLEQNFSEKKLPEHVFEINHCLEGRMECGTGEGFFYLSPGDLSISRGTDSGRATYFPTGQYYGIGIIVDAQKAPRCLSCFLDDVDVKPYELMEKFLGSSGCFVRRADTRLGHIFSELYCVPEAIKKGYMKVKVLELLLFLTGMEPERTQEEKRYYSENQVMLAKNVCAFISSHVEEKITIDRLAEEFHVSATQLKNSFKGVYGVSVYAFVRAQKMYGAARLLEETNATILEIAGKFDYDNGSKFAKAFRDVMGKPPKQYRKEKKV